MSKTVIELQYKTIVEMLAEGTTALDLGCGSGELLSRLAKEKGIKGQGIELNEESIFQCVSRGISVFHGDIERGLIEYPDKAFDYVLLNQSMQEIKNVDYVLEEALRVGKQVVVGFPNFAFIRSRIRLFFGGCVPVTSSLPYRWYDTPNVHFLSIKDFYSYCSIKNIFIVKACFLGKKRYVRFFPNLLASNAIFVLQKESLPH